jgi:hypothetical protein
MVFPSIGSISSVSAHGEPVVGRIATAVAEGVSGHGPFSSEAAYFGAVADAAVSKLKPSGSDVSWASLGSFVFRDIVQNTALYDTNGGRFRLNHMDLGTQNILVDDEFNFLAIIDWEFAQTAPWSAHHYPMAFPLAEPDAEIEGILNDPDHLAHKAVSRQESARRLYVQMFRAAETKLREEDRNFESSYADVLNGPPSRVFACFTRLGRLSVADERLVREMVRLAFDFDGGKTGEYLDKMRDRAR